MRNAYCVRSRGRSRCRNWGPKMANIPNSIDRSSLTNYAVRITHYALLIIPLHHRPNRKMIRRVEFALLVAVDAGFEGGEVVSGQDPVDGDGAIPPAEIVTGSFVCAIAPKPQNPNLLCYNIIFYEFNLFQSLVILIHICFVFKTILLEQIRFKWMLSLAQAKVYYFPLFLSCLV